MTASLSGLCAEKARSGRGRVNRAKKQAAQMGAVRRAGYTENMQGQPAAQLHEDQIKQAEGHKS
jgi:hypothetical protein